MLHNFIHGMLIGLGAAVGAAAVIGVAYLTALMFGREDDNHLPGMQS